MATERQPKYTILQCYHAVSRRINREHMGGWFRYRDAKLLHGFLDTRYLSVRFRNNSFRLQQSPGGGFDTVHIELPGSGVLPMRLIGDFDTVTEFLDRVIDVMQHMSDLRLELEASVAG